MCVRTLGPRTLQRPALTPLGAAARHAQSLRRRALAVAEPRGKRSRALRGEMLEAAAVPRLAVGEADAGVVAARRDPWSCLGRA